MSRKTYTDEFKKQIVTLHKSGKSISQLSRDYNISKVSIHKWCAYDSNSGSFKVADNRTPQEIQLIKLEKENAQLRMENDLLKQAALILGRK